MPKEINVKPLRASELERRLNCSGSLAAESGLPELPVNEAAESGKRIHQALHDYFAGTDKMVGRLDDREAQITDQFIYKVLKITDQHSGLRDRISEKRITRKLLSGKPDMVAVCGDETILVVDYKTGWKPQIGSERNMQLRGYAVLVGAKYKVKGNIICALLEPDKPMSLTEYTAEDRKAAWGEIKEISRRCNKPNAPRVPGSPQCDYCRAAGNPERCPESIAFQKANLPATIPIELTPELAAKCASIWEAVTVFERNAKAFKAFVREQLKADPNAIPGLTLEPGRTIREITDAHNAFRIGAELKWFDQVSFVDEAIKIKLGALSELIQKNLDISAAKADALIETELADCIETKMSEPSVKASKLVKHPDHALAEIKEAKKDE